MSPFMDVHSVVGGVSAADTAAAHEDERETRGSYGVSYLRHWADESLRRLGPRRGRNSRLRKLLISRVVDDQRRGYGS